MCAFLGELEVYIAMTLNLPRDLTEMNPGKYADVALILEGSI